MAKRSDLFTAAIAIVFDTLIFGWDVWNVEWCSKILKRLLLDAHQKLGI